MFELSQEKTLLTSDDGSTILTSHRVIYHTGKKKQQIMLTDFINYERKTAHIGKYKALMIFFAVTTLFLVVKRGLANLEDMYDLYYYLVWPSAIFLLFSAGFFLISRRHYIRINGKFESFDIRIGNPVKKSIVRFLDMLVEQSNEVKKNNAISN